MTEKKTAKKVKTTKPAQMCVINYALIIAIEPTCCIYQHVAQFFLATYKHTY